MATDVKAAISKAKTAMVIDYPFFGTLIMSTPIEKVEWVPTMAVDGRKIYYNEAFLQKKTVNEIMFIFAHEIIHCALQHVWRAGHRDPTRWNYAIDYITNDLLVKEGIGTMPKDALFDAKLVEKAEGLAERVYELIPEIKTVYISMGDGEGEGGGDGTKERPYYGTSIDQCMPPRDTSGGADSAQEQQEWKMRVTQAINAAKMQGKLSANMERFIGEALKAKVDWRDVLRRFVSKRAKIDYTWARPKRRMIGSDIYLPSLAGQTMGKLVVAVDCSGSIGEKELTEFGSEIAAIVEDVKPAETWVLYFDAAVCGEPQIFRPGDPVTLEPRGGGGTAFWPIFKYLEEHDIDPVCCVFLTDLYGDFGKEPPEYPLLWVVNHETELPIPFGERVNMT